MMRRQYLAIGAIAVIVIALAAIVLLRPQGSTPPVASLAAPLGQRTKTRGCRSSGGLPDTACTPGAVFAGVTREQVCASGYARSVRDVPLSEKDAVYAEYGIAYHVAYSYEVDHLVSLELGGSNDIANLWPQPASPKPGYHEKDGFENYLHDQVCSGQISLEEAQRRIAGNWLLYWRNAGQP